MYANLIRKIFQLLFLLTLLYGCIPITYPPGENITSGKIRKDSFITTDGTRLPLKQWRPETVNAKAVLIALHGFNDYSHFFQEPGEFFRRRGIICYAYDQRGFGGSPRRGLWSGIDAYIQDLDLFVQLTRKKHPNLPIYLLGESMGGAVVILEAAQNRTAPIEGVILAAPAVWARDTMPWYQRVLLWTLSHTVPWLTVTGESLEVQPSDNMEMLRALAKDPLVIKGTRVETIYGLVNLMDAAVHNASKIRANTLLLYGEKDEIIPLEPTFEFIQHFMKNGKQKKTLAVYAQGYHMLLRDLQAPVLWNDISAWIQSAGLPLPSKADKRAQELFFRQD